MGRRADPPDPGHDGPAGEQARARLRRPSEVPHPGRPRGGLEGATRGADRPAGDYQPTTINGWLAILQVVMKAAKRKFALPHLATEGIRAFDSSRALHLHRGGAQRAPPGGDRSLPREVPGLHPAHFAMVYLGLFTGLRPSSLRPLRRSGPGGRRALGPAPDPRASLHTPWATRRCAPPSRSGGTPSICLPRRWAVLRWHVDTQLLTPEQRESVLLFLAGDGWLPLPLGAEQADRGGRG